MRIDSTANFKLTASDFIASLGVLAIAQKSSVLRINHASKLDAGIADGAFHLASRNANAP